MPRLEGRFKITQSGEGDDRWRCDGKAPSARNISVGSSFRLPRLRRRLLQNKTSIAGAESFYLYLLLHEGPENTLESTHACYATHGR